MENVHRGSIAVVDAGGRLRYCAGDAARRAFLRSGAKPFQAMPAILSGAVQRFGLSQREIAILCASHSGEPRHEESVLGVLHKIGLDEAHLRCGTHSPISAKAAEDRIRQGRTPTPVCNNCSGSHAGMLAACVANGWSPEDYTDPDHPLQRQILAILGAFAGVPVDSIELATDNCTVPTFRLPLRATATAFARLATGSHVPSELAKVADTIRRAMTGEPGMVGGEGRFDSDVMAAAEGSVVAKGGADGFQGMGLAGPGLGVAIKISDGNEVAATTAATHVLASLRVWGRDLPAGVAVYRTPDVRAADGGVVGKFEPIFELDASDG